MSLEKTVPTYCVNHLNCTVMVVPKSCLKIKMPPEEVAYVGIGINNAEQKNDICYLRFCRMDGNKFVVEDIMGNIFTYGRINIIAYMPLPDKLPDNDKNSTIIIDKASRAESYDMKCYYCNSDASEFMMYIENGVKKCTAVCNNICASYFERNVSDINCVECGNSGLYKQRWTAFQNEDMKKIVRFRYCHGSAECLDNIMTKFQKIVGSELLHRCEQCGKSGNENEFKKCGRCLTVKYCGKDCQVANWKNHKLVCKIINS